jgi:hypothetical protein
MTPSPSRSRSSYSREHRPPRRAQAWRARRRVAMCPIREWLNWVESGHATGAAKPKCSDIFRIAGWEVLADDQRLAVGLVRIGEGPVFP